MSSPTTILAWGTEGLAKAGAIMKQLRSTETLGSTSAINSDKTGTLTLNQMTAVRMSVVGRRYTVEGTGYSTRGQITRVAGHAEVPLDQFLMPMVLASDAALRDGQLIGDPTEGALIALAAKGGVDAASTRQEFPRLAEVPFDAAYKLMATFHRMTDESGTEVIRCFVKGAPDQLLGRAATVFDADSGPVPIDAEGRRRYLEENKSLGEQGLRVLATARKDIDPATFDPATALLPQPKSADPPKWTVRLARHRRPGHGRRLRRQAVRHRHRNVYPGHHPGHGFRSVPGAAQDNPAHRRQWLSCAAVALSIVLVSEIQKAILRHR